MMEIGQVGMTPGFDPGNAQVRTLPLQPTSVCKHLLLADGLPARVDAWAAQRLSSAPSGEW